MISASSEIASLSLASVALFAAAAFFWRENRIAGIGFLVAFAIAFSAVVGQRVVLSSVVMGISFERTAPSK